MPMPPPRAGKKPGVTIAVGVGPKMPPPSGGAVPKEGIDHAEAHDQDPESTGKATREKALYIPTDHHCGQCANYDATSGECSKVEGVFDLDDCCLRYFAHADAEDEEPDADDQGGPPDMEADDTQQGM